VKPAAFEYLRPASLAEALGLLARGGDGAKLLAGGQSLGPMMNMRLAQPRQLVDVNDLTELSYARDAGSWIELGALTRHHEVAASPLVREACPLLAEAARTIGHYAIRQRGTIGGSIAHADPAAQFVLAAITLGARLRIVREGGERELPASEFFRAPMTTALEAGEMLLAIRFPRARADEGAALRLFNRRRGDYAIVAAAATVRVEGGQVADVRLGLGGLQAMPLSLADRMGPFIGRDAATAWEHDAAESICATVAAHDDGRVPAEYRRELARHLVATTLRAACDNAREHA
jgi:aerobic carbon-monoxide dehydrogenase medium subunit